MGDPKRRRKKYTTPGHPYQKQRLESELVLVGKYGLRNKRELWMMRTKLGTYRKEARNLLALDPEERKERGKVILAKLIRYGILGEDATTDDILALDVEAFLKRRLQTLVFELGYARTIHQARQLIAHRHIEYNGHIINVPSFLVPKTKENEIKMYKFSPFTNPSHPMAPLAKPSNEEPSAETNGEIEEPVTEEKPKSRGRRGRS